MAPGVPHGDSGFRFPSGPGPTGGRPGVTPHFETPCPHCQHPLRVRVEYIDHWVTCKYCERRFKPQRSSDAIPVATPASGAAAAPAKSVEGETALRAELTAVCAERDRLRRLVS